MGRTRWLGKILMATIFALPLAAASQNSETRRIDIPAGDLAAALDALAKVSEVEFIYRSDQLGGLHTDGVRGSPSPEAALHRLLEGTGFVAHRDTSGAFLIIKDGAAQSLAPATSTQRAAGTAEVAAPTMLETVIVTGSRIQLSEIEAPVVTILSGEQMRAEGFVTLHDALSTLNEAIGTVEADLQWGSHTPNASPINLRNMGPGRSLLLVNGRRVPDYPLPYGGQSNFANYSNIPTSAVDRVEILTGGASAIYGSDAVAGVINIILKTHQQGDEVRVLGGTSTEGGRDTWDLSWSGGKGGERWDLTYALQYSKRNPLFGRDRPGMDHTDDAPPSSWNAEQRKVGFRPSVGLVLIDRLRGRLLAPPAGACEKFAGEFWLADRLVYDRNTGATVDTGQMCSMKEFTNWILASGAETASGYLHARWDFAEDVSAWTSVILNDSKAQWSTSPPTVFLNNGLFYDAELGTYLAGLRSITPDEAGGVAGLRNLNKETSWDLSVGLSGTFGDGRMDWDASLGRAYYRVHERIATIDSDRADDFFIGPRLGTTAQGFAIHDLDDDRWWNPVTPEQYQQFAAVSLNESVSWLNQAAIGVRGELVSTPNGPVRFAGVLEAAKQGYRLGPDPRAGIDYAVTHIDRGGGERTRHSIGAEFKLPLLESMTATVAGRHDRYADYRAFDAAARLNIDAQSETTWNLGLQWRPLDRLLLRGALATSFRAPDMHYLMAQPGVAVQTRIDTLRCIQSGAYLTNNCTTDNIDVSYTFAINRRGTPDLKAELGHSWTAGLAWDATDRLSMTADYWSIHLEDEIREIDEDTILRDEAGCITGLTVTPGEHWRNPVGSDYCDTILARVTRDANGRIVAVERGAINIARKEVAGVDLSARYRLEAGRWGAFQVGLNYTNLLTLREQFYRTDPNPNRRDRDIRSKVRGSIGWEKRNWSANVYGSRIGSVPGVRYHWSIDQLDNPGGCLPFPDGGTPDSKSNCRDTDPRSPTFGQSTAKYYGRVGPAIVWNFNLGYQVTENASVRFYVNNAFNSAGWNHKDPYKLEYEFYNSRLFGPVGRELALEYILRFD